MSIDEAAKEYSGLKLSTIETVVLHPETVRQFEKKAFVAGAKWERERILWMLRYDIDPYGQAFKEVWATWLEERLK